MAEKFSFYRCAICGNIVQVLNPGEGVLICCGKEMALLDVQRDAGELGEKHSPRQEEHDGRKFVHVKSHPMINEHYIQFMQILSDDKNEMYTKFFYPGQEPEIDVTNFSGNLSAVEYCNIHHLWGMSQD